MKNFWPEMSRSRWVGRAAVCAVVSALWSAAIQARGSDGGSDGFKQAAVIFLESYCLECDDEETKKGGVLLEGLTEVSAENAAMWAVVTA